MNDLAYRYANAETFLKMLDSQELWFTDLRQMNDWDEYAAGFRIANELMVDEFSEYAYILEEISPERMSSKFMVLICSFSSDGDCLSMWRGYGDNGSGASVGYSTHDMENHHLFDRYLQRMSPVNGKVNFKPVIYSEESYRASIRSYFKRIISIPEDADPVDVPALLGVRIKMFGGALTRLCTLYKNDFFQDEREIRGFIEINDIVSPYDVGSRPTEFGAAAFHKISTNFMRVPSIKEVTLGPRCELSGDYVRDKLNEFGLPEVIIKHSRGTYR